MIRGLILDIDGVLVGEKIGFNSPFPHPDVLEKIRKIHDSGIFVTLCTGKPHYAIGQIIADCKLNNPHITDGGAIIIDPIQQTIVKKHVMNPSLVTNLIRTYIQANIYIEIYTTTGYIIQKNQFRENLTPVHSHILQTPPHIVESLELESQKHEVIKVMPVAKNEIEKQHVLDLFKPFTTHAIMSMGTHPIANPHQFGLITSIGVSKGQSAIDAMGALGLSMSDCLGVGDSTSDWQFMELTGSAATLGNGTTQLKNLVSSKQDKGFVTDTTVDENGILTIFNHFLN